MEENRWIRRCWRWWGSFQVPSVGFLAEVHMILDISRLISTASEMAPGCHCCATVEQQKSLILWDVKKMEWRPRDKAWITGSAGWGPWSASSTDCKWLRVLIWQMLCGGSSPFPTAQVYTSQPVLSSALRGQTSLGCSFPPQFLLFASSNPSLLQGRKKKTNPNQPQTQQNPIRCPPQTELVST